MSAPADWQLPPGVSREVWDYLHNVALARRYDACLAGTPLFDADRSFVLKHCPTRGRILDLGCGTGRIAIPLAQRGDRVTAVDLSEEMLRVVGVKATAAGTRLNRAKAKIVALDAFRDQSFDAIVCLFSTLGMVTSCDHRRRVVSHSFRLLRPGGIFVLHVHNRWHNLRSGPGRHWLLCDLARSLVGAATTGDWRMENHEGETGWPIHLFTRREVCRLLRGEGFRLVEVQPISTVAPGPLRYPWWFGRLRAYGYLIAVQRPE